MSVADLYPWLKALHVASVLVFVGGVLAAAIVLRAPRIAEDTEILAAARRWDRMVTTPAMLLVWAAGFLLAQTGRWFGDHWLQGKLILAILISAIHGIQSGQLRRAAPRLADARRCLLPMLIGAIITIAILAVVKP